jgi:hypothetical protein
LQQFAYGQSNSVFGNTISLGTGIKASVPGIHSNDLISQTVGHDLNLIGLTENGGQTEDQKQTQGRTDPAPTPGNE